MSKTQHKPSCGAFFSKHAMTIEMVSDDRQQLIDAIYIKKK